MFKRHEMHLKKNPYKYENNKEKFKKPTRILLPYFRINRMVPWQMLIW